MKRRDFYLVLVVMTALLPGGCSPGVTRSRIIRIKQGMNPDAVVALLGPPTRIRQSETTGMTGRVYDYVSDVGTARIVFVNDTVFKADFSSKENRS